ncbi:uncharacterized protein LOC125373261 [Haliotis rufescens]|uniref:uncharacterized protein LOC125373261 n=1 Tax=Haliotis rufescens TaxID=6454 RepID=UPI00201E8DEB|nr:uncharacterized protein LOC125373261 [Haliotis rufescens]
MSLQQSGSSRNEKKRRIEDIDHSYGNTSSNIDSWARFLVIEASDKLPIKLNPFAISKAISGICGEVKNVTRLRSGSLLVECARRQQTLNLLSITTFADIEVAVHRTLNSCRGIVRDRARCLSDMSEEDIAAELEEQAVTAVKRFTVKKDGVISNTNTYLLTFARTSIPQSIKAGYFNIGVEVYVPNPLRCYKCQQFGHGSKSCNNSVVCHRCGGTHESSDCEKDFYCFNCHGPHPASSRSCPVWQRESNIMKIKSEKNISYLEAKKLFTHQTSAPANITYSAAVTRSVTTWVKSEQPVVTASIKQSISIATQSSAGSQTESQPETNSQTESQPENKSSTSMSLPDTIPLTRKEKKKLNRKPTTTVPTCSEVPLQNFFGPLDMEVTLSSQDRQRSSSSSHSRERSPIEPP